MQLYGVMGMKTTLELPSELMRRVRVRAAETDRRMRDVVVEALEAALAGASGSAATARSEQDRGSTEHGSRLDPELEALFAAGDAMAAARVDFEAWRKHSRDVWR